MRTKDLFFSVGTFMTLSLIMDRFAAALIDFQVDCWVMNVVPVSGFNTLPVIYDRGLIGVRHDWYVLSTFSCELLLVFAFSNIISLNISNHQRCCKPHQLKR